MVAGLLLGSAAPAHAAEREFALRYSQNGWANVEQAGNVLLTCPASDTRCAANQTGSGTLNNNVFAMIYVDVDGDPTTFNSSTARVVVPPGATVDIALLYWGGDTGEPLTPGNTPRCSSVNSTAALPPNPAAANQVRVKVGAGGYTPVTAAAFDFVTNSPAGKPFQGRADITTMFDSVQRPAAATPVDVTVADLQSATGTNCSGGWTIVLVYLYPSGADPLVSPNPTYAPAFRNVSIFDGFRNVGANDPPETITLSGFLTATTGSVDGRIGVVSYEGDRGTTGDSMAINGVPIAPVANFFDSTVAGSSYAVPPAALPGVGQVAPVLTNNLGYDSKTAAVPPGVIPNGATSVTATFSTNGDAYQPGVFVFTARIQPMADLTKTVTRNGVDVNHQDVAAGDRLRYTVTVRNVGDLAWTDGVVTDAVPDGLTPAPGTLTLDGTPLTDAAGDDAGQLAGQTYTVDVGPLAVNATRTIAFDVTVDPDAPAGATLVNRAVVDFHIGGSAFNRSAQADVITNRIDLALTKSVTPATVPVGGEATFTLTLTSQNAAPASGIVVTDTLPEGLVAVAAAPSLGGYDLASGVWTVGALAGNGTAALTLRARVERLGSLVNVAEVTAAGQPDIDSAPGNNDPAEDDIAEAAVTGVDAPVPPTPEPGQPIAGMPVTGLPVNIRAAIALGFGLVLAGAALYGSMRQPGRSR